MKKTNLGLKKPEGTDPVNIQDLNDNMDLIETQLQQRPVKTGDASEMKANFTQASAVINLTSGESIKTSFGKIAKTIAEFLTHKSSTATAAAMGHVKLSDTFSSAVTNGAAANGMAASQKAVADTYAQLNNNLKWKTYNNITQLGLTASTCTTNKIIDALDARKPAILAAPMLMDDYPSVNFASTGKKHLYSVYMSAEGYVSLQDHDLSNNALYYCSHTGSSYSSWYNSNLGSIDNWIDITIQSNWGESGVIIEDTGAYRSWLRYNPKLRLLKGVINTKSTIKNQDKLVIMPHIEGVGRIPFVGLCGIGYTKDASMIIMPRIDGNIIYSSHNEAKSVNGAIYLIDLAY